MRCERLCHDPMQTSSSTLDLDPRDTHLSYVFEPCLVPRPTSRTRASSNPRASSLLFDIPRASRLPHPSTTTSGYPLTPKAYLPRYLIVSRRRLLWIKHHGALDNGDVRITTRYCSHVISRGRRHIYSPRFALLEPNDLVLLYPS